MTQQPKLAVWDLVDRLEGELMKLQAENQKLKEELERQKRQNLVLVDGIERLANGSGRDEK